MQTVLVRGAPPLHRITGPVIESRTLAVGCGEVTGSAQLLRQEMSLRPPHGMDVDACLRPRDSLFTSNYHAGRLRLLPSEAPLPSPPSPPLRSPMSIAPLDIFQFGEKEACLGWLGTHARADRHRDTVRVFSEDASYRFIWRGGAPQPPHTRRGRRSVCIKGMSMSAGLCVSPSRSFSLVLWVVQRLLFFHPYWFFGP